MLTANGQRLTATQNQRQRPGGTNLQRPRRVLPRLIAKLCILLQHPRGWGDRSTNICFSSCHTHPGTMSSSPPPCPPHSHGILPYPTLHEDRKNACDTTAGNWLGIQQGQNINLERKLRSAYGVPKRHLHRVQKETP
jgi:hypothetical protein